VVHRLPEGLADARELGRHQLLAADAQHGVFVQ
jgi:hypothetical protein